MTVGVSERAPRGELLLVGGMVLAISTGAFFRVPLLPSIGAELSMSVGQLGALTSVFALGRLATDIPAGRLADRVPHLRALALGGALLSIGSLAMALAPTALLVLAAAFVLGVASAVSNTTGMTYFSTAAPVHQRGMSMAMFSAALLGGQALGPMVGGTIGTTAGWRVAVAFAAGVGAIVALTGSRLHRSERGQRMAARNGAGARAGSESVPSGTRRPSLPSKVMPLQRFLLYSVAFASFFLLGAMPQTLVPIIGDASYALEASTIGLALGVGGVCRFLGAMVGGRIADRISRKAALVPGMGLGAIGVAILAVDLGPAGWMTAIVLLSLGSYGTSVAATMLADHARGAGVGRKLGSYRFAGDIGLITGPVVAGLLYQSIGVEVAVLTVAGLVGLIALLCAAFLRETRWLDEPPGGPGSPGTAP